MSLAVLAFFFLSVPVSDAGFEGSSLAKASRAFHEGQYAAALKTLRQIQGRKGSPDSSRALFLQGLTLMGLEHWQEAKEIFLRLRGRYRRLADYIKRNVLICDQRLGRHEEVVRGGLNFFSHQTKSRLTSEVRLLLIKSHMALGKWRKAEALCQGMLTNRAGSKNAPKTFLLYHEAMRRLDRPVKAYQALQKVYYYFPNRPEATIAEEKMRDMLGKRKRHGLPSPSFSMLYARLTRLAGKGQYAKVLEESSGAFTNIKYPGNIRGKVALLRGACYRSLKDYSKSVSTYQRYLRKFPHASQVPEAMYWISKIQWNMGQPAKALRTCDRLMKKYPKSLWTLRAHFISGGVLEDRGDFKGAVKRYESLLDQSPANGLAEKASWKIAWIHYQKKDYTKSLRYLKKIIRQYPLSLQRERALFWATICAKALKRPKEASAFLSELSRTHTFGFYMHLAKKVFDDRKHPDPFKINPAGLPEAGLSRDSLPERLQEPRLSPGARYHLERVRELTKISLTDDAREELKFVYRGIQKKKMEEVLWLGLLYYQARAYRPLLSLMDNFLITISPKNRRRLPELFWRLYYPPAYREIVTKVSAKYDVDPYLVLGLIRQESAFDESSLSSAGALGLMQLIPKTGKGVFQKLYKDQLFTEDLLYEPERNIEIGSFHLAQLLKRNRGDMINVLVGYNAGPRILTQWEKRFRQYSGEGFIEMIPYGETKRYVKKVLRNYYNYRRLYGKER